MPSVTYCDLNDAFGLTEWERSRNKPAPGSAQNFRTFTDAMSCTSRNNEFQNGIAQTQFGQPLNPLNVNQDLGSSIQGQNGPQNGQGIQTQAPTHITSVQQAPVQQQVAQQIQQEYQDLPLEQYPQSPYRIPQYYNVYPYYYMPLPNRWGMQQYGQQYGPGYGYYGSGYGQANGPQPIEAFGNMFSNNILEQFGNIIDNPNLCAASQKYTLPLVIFAIILIIIDMLGFVKK
jgi:hypothetical protein